MVAATQFRRLYFRNYLGIFSAQRVESMARSYDPGNILRPDRLVATMKESLRQSMSWLHTWTGLLLGWVLYFIFITGTTGYLDTEIDRWMQPELPPASQVTFSQQEMLHASVDYLNEHVPNAKRWFISLQQTRDRPYPYVSWQGAKSENIEENGKRFLNPDTDDVFPSRETAGGYTLYRLHWKLRYLPEVISDWIVGIATMFMLVALITGIIVHKNIFRDFFTFRPRKGQRSWLDAHNLVSVVSLPFQLMITYSGLIFMMFIYVPLIIAAWYGPGEDNRVTFYNEIYKRFVTVDPSGQRAPLTSLDAVVAKAEDKWQGSPTIDSLDIRLPGDINGGIIVRSSLATAPLRAYDALFYDGVTGDLSAERPLLHSTSKGPRDVMLGLHEGLFAGPFLRALYILSGLLGAAMIATGLILWVVKRRKRVLKGDSYLGFHLIEGLNVATIVGLPIAIAAYFWASRLLPVNMEDRADWEIHSLFLCWLAMITHAIIRPSSRAWIEQSAIAAIAFGLLPLLNAFTTDRGFLTSIINSDWLFAGFDIGFFTTAAAFAWLTHYLARRNVNEPTKRSVKEPQRSPANSQAGSTS